MDFEGWEVLPEYGYLEIQYDGNKKIFSRKYVDDDINNLYNNHYFSSPSLDSSEFMESSEKSRTMVPNQLLHVPIKMSPSHNEEVIKEIINKEPITKSSSASLEEIKSVPDSGIPLKANYDPVSQVFFKKKIENKSAYTKIDSPKSNNKGIIPHMDPGSFQFENKANPMKDEALETKNSWPKSENEKITETKKDASDEATWGEDSGGLNIWKWSLNGFGTICSFGVVAASICIIILGRRKQKKQLLQNQKLQFHIFAEDKHATRLNEAMRGAQGVGAHITFGGAYEGL